MSRAALAIAGMMLLVAACGPLHQLPAAQSMPPGTIPWLPLQADLTPVGTPASSPQGAPVPPGTPACTAQDLVGAVLGSQGATGNVVVFVAFAGTGTSDCYVEGTPNVTALDPAGRAIPFKQRAPYVPALVTGPQLVSPGPVPQPDNALKYGEAGLNVDWESQPEACQGQSGVTVAALRVFIQGSEALTLAVPSSPEAYVCGGLGVGSFESQALPVDQAPPSPVPAITVQIQGPAVPGRNFQYLVTLTNDSRQPLDFTVACPNYEEELFPDIAHGSPPLGGKHFYRLNCAPAGTLAPGRQEVFQMILSVPANATSGAYTLLFAMGYTNAMTRYAQHPVVVAKAA